jgi:hypothetical protein
LKLIKALNAKLNVIFVILISLPTFLRIIRWLVSYKSNWNKTQISKMKKRKRDQMWRKKKGQKRDTSIAINVDYRSVRVKLKTIYCHIKS